MYKNCGGENKKKKAIQIKKPITWCCEKKQIKNNDLKKTR
jgi:hypothetical protein